MDVEKLKNTFESMIHLKNTSSYLDEFGGSLFMSVLVLIVFFYICSYFYVASKLKMLREDWTHVRCHPAYIPFASMINPDPHMSASEFTQQNFSYCTNNILTSIAHYFTLPFTYAISVFVSMFDTLIKDANIIRNKFADLVNNIISIDKEIMRRILTTMIPIQHMVIKLRDMYRKAVGTLITGAFTIASGLYIVEALVKNFITLMIMALYVILAIIIPLLWFFFTWPLAIAPIITFATMAAFLMAVIIILAPIYDIPNTTVPSKPSVPSCFDMQTPLKMNDGSWKYIYELVPDDVLEGGNLVTAVFKMSATGIDMYSYKNIIISGSHSIFLTWDECYRQIKDEYIERVNIMTTKKNGVEGALYDEFMYDAGDELGMWVPVQWLKAPFVSKCEDYNGTFVYCLNTVKKYIPLWIHNELGYPYTKHLNILMYAMDWDEISGRKHSEIIQQTIERRTRLRIPQSLQSCPSLFHTYLESGLSGNNQIMMADGKTRLLKDIQVGDVLRSPNIQLFGEKTEYYKMYKSGEKKDYIGKEYANTVAGIVKISKRDIGVWTTSYTSQMLNSILGETVGAENGVIATQNNCLIGVKNNEFEIYNLIEHSPLENKSESWYSYLFNVKKTNKIEEYDEDYYHLVTTEGMFYINEFIFADYNMGIDYWTH